MIIEILGTIFIFGIGLFLITKTQFLTYLYDVRINNNGVEFLIFKKIKIHHLSFSNIDYVRRMHGKDYKLIFVTNFKNRPFQSALLIHKKKSWYSKDVLITPSNEKDFLKFFSDNKVEIKE